MNEHDAIYTGFVDVHVHAREPGHEYKETIETASRTALLNGIDQILLMPNTSPATDSFEELMAQFERAKVSKLGADVGFNFAATGASIKDFNRVEPYVFAYKLYADPTTNITPVSREEIKEIVAKMPRNRVLMLHAEGDSLHFTLEAAYGNTANQDVAMHVCHISRADEVEAVRRYKDKGFPITAGVTPHHLIRTHIDVQELGPRAMMKPELGDENDRRALIAALQDGTIDIVESDHAPHTWAEKESGAYGVPGLDTMVAFVHTLHHNGLLTNNRFGEVLGTKARSIFKLPPSSSWIRINSSQSYGIPDWAVNTKCGWSAFPDLEFTGKVTEVVQRGIRVVENGRIVHDQPLGRILTPTPLP